MTKVFIDGSAGTTGLQIADRLKERKDITLLSLTEEHRKDPAYRKEAFQKADIVFLCLPDDAAREAVLMMEGMDTVVIDASTAHRTAPGWEYGFPELKGRRERIRNAKRIANPGCHASGFIALVEPLIQAGLLKKDTPLTAFSLTGYSGGGKKMIAEYEAPDRNPLLDAPRQYALSQNHKHLPEIKAVCQLSQEPLFCPIAAPYYRGMEVTVPLFRESLNGSIADLKDVYREYYQTALVHYCEVGSEGNYLSAGAFAGRDDMEILVTGNEERILLISRFDNLGKGASGAAIQNMNLVMGAAETTGLVFRA